MGGNGDGGALGTGGAGDGMGWGKGLPRGRYTAQMEGTPLFAPKQAQFIFKLALKCFAPTLTA
jgi:hypothetical protein